MTERRARLRPRPTAEIRRVVAVLALLLGACDAVAPASAAVTSRTAAAAPATAGSPLVDLDAASFAKTQWTGVIEQSLDARPYTYLAVRDGDALRWVAIMGAGRAPGSTVVVSNMGARRDFYSRRLDRTFDEIVFGVIEEPKP